jgi:hypothetical protein
VSAELADTKTSDLLKAYMPAVRNDADADRSQESLELCHLRRQIELAPRDPARR